VVLAKWNQFVDDVAKSLLLPPVEVAMAVSESAVKAVLKEFCEENPGSDAQGAHITDSDRTWEEQLDFIIDRPNSYPSMKRFCKEFELKKPPAKRKDLDDKQLKWWEKTIMSQAGKSPGFPHVGGKAIDVGVGKVSADLKVKLYEKLKEKFDVLAEKGEDYDVAPKDATCFHCT
jgi:hypothetical protein